MIEIARRSIPGDFRAIDTTSARVVLVEAQDRVLSGGFPQALSEKARLDLAELGVEVCLRSRVTAIDADGVTIESLGSPSATERIRATNVIWAAGVLASPLGASLGAPIDRSGRVIVESDLSIPSHPEVFVTGDLAHVKHEKYGQVPGMCPAAVQMGKHAARLILAQVCGRAPATRAPFVYSDKGLLATIGRARAVAALPSAGFSGFPAWLLWAMVHIFFLISFRAKVLVMIEWAWAYFVFERGARLITGEGAAASAGAARRA
jgi:NADH dehydrogenase